MRHSSAHGKVKQSHFSIIPAFLLLGATILVGIVITEQQNLIGKAATFLSFEAESGSNNATATQISDSAASGGKAVVLAVPTTTGPLPAVSNIRYTCAPAGNSVTFTWSPLAEAANYQLRLDFQPDSWQPAADARDQMPGLMATSSWTTTIVPNSEYWMTIQAVRSTDSYPYPGVYGGTGRFTCSGTAPTSPVAPTPTTAANTVNIPVTVTVTNPSADWDISIHQWQTQGTGTPVECARVRADRATITATCYNLPRRDGINYYAVGAVGVRRSDGMRSVPDEDFIMVPLTGNPNPTSAAVNINLTVPTVFVRGDKSSSISEISRGQMFSYTISAFDEYNITSQTATIVDNIDSRLVIRNASVSNGTCTITGQQVRCTAPTKYNRPLTITIGVTMSTTAAPLGALVANTATVTIGNKSATTDTVQIRINP
jgi:hypothetical protein